MRKTSFFSGAVLLVGMTVFGISSDNIVPKCAVVVVAQPVGVSGKSATENPAARRANELRTKSTTRLTAETQAVEPTTETQSIDNESIRQASESFVEAYDRGDAQAIAALFTTDAEYVDELGEVFHGRAAIEESMTEFFSENPDCKLDVTIDTIRFIGPGIAVEDGSTTISCPDVPDTIASRYTTVYVKTDGKWLAASIRDHAPKDRKQHRTQLAQLDWLVGDWVDEGEDALVTFSCQPVDNGNFLLRQFTIQVGGDVAMSGTQRIGWDPLTGKLRTWIFDSEGAYGEGLWHRDGDDWVLKCTGVMSDGQTASSTSIYTYVDDHTMTWQSVDHEIAGVQQPDSEVYTIVRQAPAPVLTNVTEQ